MKARDYLTAAPCFTCDDSQRAYEAWRFNCGPGAIAAVVRVTPDELRPYLGDFERKGYTNPTLMFDILKRLGVAIRRLDRGVIPSMRQWPTYGLVRIQWHGPWMADGVPMPARYRHTHWIGSLRLGDDLHDPWQAFDINCMGVGGWIPMEEWENQFVPWFLPQVEPKGDGDWSITHSIEVVGGIRTAQPAEQPQTQTERR